MRKYFRCLVEAFVNYFVAYIPSWAIRKLFYRAFGMKIGKGSRINQRVYVFKPWLISIGENTMINSFSLLDGRGGLEIGDSVSISMGAMIYSASHKSYSDTFEYYERKTRIGNYAWICAKAIVLPGSEIKDFCIISANSVIKGKTKERGIYMGIPASFTCLRKLQAGYTFDNSYYFL